MTPFSAILANSTYHMLLPLSSDLVIELLVKFALSVWLSVHQCNVMCLSRAFLGFKSSPALCSLHRLLNLGAEYLICSNSIQFCLYVSRFQGIILLSYNNTVVDIRLDLSSLLIIKFRKRNRPRNKKLCISKGAPQGTVRL